MWRELTAAVDTIVILMGLHNLRTIMTRLMECGYGMERPVAVIDSGTRVCQKTLCGTVGTIAELAEKNSFDGPVLIVIGQVAAMAKSLEWFPRSLSKEFLGKSSEDSAKWLMG